MSLTTVLLMMGIVGIFAGIFLSLTAIGVFTNEARGISKSLAVIQAFSAAPQALQDEMAPGFQDRVLGPFVDRFTALGRRLTPSDYNERIMAKLNVAGNPPGWTADRVISLKALGIGVGLVAGVLFGVLLGKGGLGFDSALSQVARNTEGPLANEFARVLQEMQIGLGRSNALRALGERSNLPDLRSFCSAMVQADAFGIPVGQVLRVQSSEIRVKRRQKAEEAAQKIPVKIMIPLVLFILPSLFVAVIGPAVIGMMGVFGGGGALN
jgi:tight adherence protein C